VRGARGDARLGSIVGSFAAGVLAFGVDAETLDLPAHPPDNLLQGAAPLHPRGDDRRDDGWATLAFRITGPGAMGEGCLGVDAGTTGMPAMVHTRGSLAGPPDDVPQGLQPE